MWNKPTKERLAKIPGRYETENVPLKDKIIYLHFFIFGSDWYVAESDGDMLWGFVVLNNDFDMSEWGYFSLNELKSIDINGIEIDCELEEYFMPKKASEIDKICKGNGWLSKSSLPAKEVANGIR